MISSNFTIQTLACASILIWISHILSIRLKINSIIFYIITGVILWSQCFNVFNKEIGNLFSELWIIFLLFSIWLHIDFEKIQDMKKYLFKLWSLQLIITSLILFPFIFCIFQLFFYQYFSISTFIIISSSLSLSSSAIILDKIMQENLVDTKIWKAKLGILLFQDLIAPIILILIPILAKPDLNYILFENELLKTIWSVALLFLIILFSSKFLFIKMLDIIYTKESKYFIYITWFIIAIICSLFAQLLWINSGIWAFLGWLFIWISSYKEFAEIDTENMKEFFLSLFFVYIWSLIIFQSFSQIWLILILSLGIKFLKSISWFISCKLLHMDNFSSTLIWINLSQISEFSFIILGSLIMNWLISQDVFQIVNSVIILTMLISIILVDHSNNILSLFFKYKK